MEYTHFIKLEAYAALSTQRSVAFIKGCADIGDRPHDINGSSFYDDGDTVGRIALIHHLFIVLHILALSALDSSLYLVLRQVDRLGILHGAAQRRVIARIRAAGFNGNGNFLSDTGKLLGHAVVPREHGGLTYFEYPAHQSNVTLGAQR